MIVTLSRRSVFKEFVAFGALRDACEAEPVWQKIAKVGSLARRLRISRLFFICGALKAAVLGPALSGA
ncbi:hypothetical protein NTD87_27345 [Pseudomonas sp. 6D_7.1_Bac1]|nr:hypothetical protein [Pseudomonas sp. 6D_7.1_Bac1]